MAQASCQPNRDETADAPDGLRVSYSVLPAAEAAALRERQLNVLFALLRPSKDTHARFAV